MSREIGSRPLGVILTVRRAVFICGETEVMVPWRIVPIVYQLGPRKDVIVRMDGVDEPFFNSIVTVSLAHFIKKL